jgi:hypothetical protein
MQSGSGAGNGSSDPRRSSYGRGYWLRRCEGFLVETPTRRIGRVAGIRYGERSNEPEVLELRAGLFGRTRLLISVDNVAEIAVEERRIVLNDPSDLSGKEISEGKGAQVTIRFNDARKGSIVLDVSDEEGEELGRKGRRQARRGRRPKATQSN